MPDPTQAVGHVRETLSPVRTCVKPRGVRHVHAATGRLRGFVSKLRIG